MEGLGYDFDVTTMGAFSSRDSRTVLREGGQLIPCLPFYDGAHLEQRNIEGRKGVLVGGADIRRLGCRRREPRTTEAPEHLDVRDDPK